jgi:hypothetical protein
VADLKRSAKPVDDPPINPAVGILMATGIILPIACALIYVVGLTIPGDLLLPSALGVTIAAGVAAYCVGVRCSGRILTRLGLFGYALFALGLAFLYWRTSRPIPISPYH